MNVNLPHYPLLPTVVAVPMDRLPKTPEEARAFVKARHREGKELAAAARHAHERELREILATTLRQATVTPRSRCAHAMAASIYLGRAGRPLEIRPRSRPSPCPACFAHLEGP